MIATMMIMMTTTTNMLMVISNERQACQVFKHNNDVLVVLTQITSLIEQQTDRRRAYRQMADISVASLGGRYRPG